MIKEDGLDLQDRIGQATDWYLRFRGDIELSNERLQQWAAWFSNVDNQAAMAAVCRVSPESGMISCPELLSTEQIQADEYDGAVSVSDWCIWQRRKAELAGLRTARWRLRPRLVAVIAITAAAVGVGLMVSDHLKSLTPEAVRMYATKFGEHQDIVLSDGSTVTLGARSLLTVRYTKDQRILVLKSGEALFGVAHNPARPFTVSAGDGTITAIGTRFDVWSNLDRVTVTVTEGVVDVVPRQDPGLRGQPVSTQQSWKPTRVMRGQEVTYVGRANRSSIREADPGATDWISGRLRYHQVPLAYVAADIERYVDKKIKVTDSGATECIFTGTVNQGAIHDWLNAIQKIFPVDVSETGTGQIEIRSRQNATRHCDVQ